MAIERVKIRVQEGGHHIPEDVIRRRYVKGIENLKEFTSLSDYWIALDNSQETMRFIAEGNLNQEITIFEKASWSILTHRDDE